MELKHLQIKQHSKVKSFIKLEEKKSGQNFVVIV